MTDCLRFDHSPFMRFLGLEVLRRDKGVVEIRLPFREEFIRGDGSDWLHGGIVSALADIAGDYAVITETGGGVPTIDLRVDYLRPARRGDLVAVGGTLRVGRTVSVADVEIRDAHARRGRSRGLRLAEDRGRRRHAGRLSGPDKSTGRLRRARGDAPRVTAGCPAGSSSPR